MYLKIANINLEVEGTCKSDEMLSKFCRKKILPPQIRIKTNYARLPKIGHKTTIFKAQGFWSIYKNSKYNVIFDYFNSRSQEPSRAGFFKRDFSWGNICIDKNKSRHKKNGKSKSKNYLNPANPLSYPIGPIAFLNFLSNNLGIILHASAVKLNNDKVYLFCGRSETGKSTIARLFRDKRKAVILNDDRIVVRKKRNRFYVYSCPWYTTSEFISNEKGILDKIFFVDHGKGNSIKKLDKRKKTYNLILATYFPCWDRKRTVFSLSFLNELNHSIEAYNLKFLPDESVIDTIEKIEQ